QGCHLLGQSRADELIDGDALLLGELASSPMERFWKPEAESAHGTSSAVPSSLSRIYRALATRSPTIGAMPPSTGDLAPTTGAMLPSTDDQVTDDRRHAAERW